jgi:hypothetical protein
MRALQFERSFADLTGRFVVREIHVLIGTAYLLEENIAEVVKIRQAKRIILPSQFIHNFSFCRCNFI